MPTADCDLYIDMEQIKALVVDGLQRRMKNRVKDMRPAWDEVLAQVYTMEENLFANEGRNKEEGPWDRLSENVVPFHHIERRRASYAAWKRNTHPGAKILHLSGKLEGQLTGKGGAYTSKQRGKLVFGTNYENFADVPDRPRKGELDVKGDRLTGDLGGFLASGRKRPSGAMGTFPMPARTPIRIDEPAAVSIAQPIVDHLVDAIR